MSALEAIRLRRSVRSFTEEKVNEDTVRSLLDAAVWAPTAMHREPWSFVVVQDPASLKRYSERAKTLATASAPLRPPTEGDATAHVLGLLSDPTFNIFYDASTLVAICAPSHDAFAAADCWLAAENLMLAACALGLGTCPIGFAVPVLNDAEIKAELSIPGDVSAVAPVIVGHPRGTSPAPSRRPPRLLRWA
jgi:nitroreductase